MESGGKGGRGVEREERGRFGFKQITSLNPHIYLKNVQNLVDISIFLKALYMVLELGNQKAKAKKNLGYRLTTLDPSSFAFHSWILGFIFGFCL